VETWPVGALPCPVAGGRGVAGGPERPPRHAVTRGRGAGPARGRYGGHVRRAAAQQETGDAGAPWPGVGGCAGPGPRRPVRAPLPVGGGATGSGVCSAARSRPGPKPSPSRRHEPGAPAPLRDSWRRHPKPVRAGR